MVRIILAAVMLMIAAADVQAKMMIGHGIAVSCGAWTKKERSNYTSRAWILGYLSGVNTSSGPDFLERVDAAAIFAWIDNYCQKNPLDDIADAVHRLQLVLMLRTSERQ